MTQQNSDSPYRIVRADYQLHTGWKVEQAGQPIAIFFGPAGWTQAIQYRDSLQAKEPLPYARQEVVEP